MKNLKNLVYDKLADTSVTAELWSSDKSQVFRIKFCGYEPEDEWLMVDVEYASPTSLYRCLKWEFDTVSLARAVRNFRKIYEIENELHLLSGPYVFDDQLILKYQKGRLKPNRRPFRRHREGFYIFGGFGSFKFSFKVDRISLFRFLKELKVAENTFPPRTALGKELTCG